MIECRPLLLLVLSLSFIEQSRAIPLPGAAEEKQEDRALLTKSVESSGNIPRAQLTAEEEKTVLALARKQGITKVVKIKTYNLYPSSDRGISVQGAESAKDREISYQVLNIKYKKWFHPGQNPQKVKSRWVSSGQASHTPENRLFYGLARQATVVDPSKA